MDSRGTIHKNFEETDMGDSDPWRMEAKGV
jgi:hypothetical protein